MAEPYLVYVGAAKDVWRFVYFAKRATSGQDAIRQAWAEAIETEQDSPTGNYMAVPYSAITTVDADSNHLVMAMDAEQRDATRTQGNS